MIAIFIVALIFFTWVFASATGLEKGKLEGAGQANRLYNLSLNSIYRLKIVVDPKARTEDGEQCLVVLINHHCHYLLAVLPEQPPPQFMVVQGSDFKRKIVPC